MPPGELNMVLQSSATTAEAETVAIPDFFSEDVRTENMYLEKIHTEIEPDQLLSELLYSEDNCNSDFGSLSESIAQIDDFVLNHFSDFGNISDKPNNGICLNEDYLNIDNIDVNASDNTMNIDLADLEREFSFVLNNSDNIDLREEALICDDSCKSLLRENSDNLKLDSAVSVLGVDLNLYYDAIEFQDLAINSTAFEKISYNDAEVKQLSEKVDEFFNDALENNLTSDNSPTNYFDQWDIDTRDRSGQTYEITWKIQNMFPHINDERNRRRRSLLYENSCRPRINENNLEEKSSVMKRRIHSALLSHDYVQKKSEEEKLFECPITNCQKIYSKSSHLKAHLRRHSGEKPFVCNWINCTWKFSRSDELARHKRSHSGIKPYKCEICEKAFARSDHLAKHKKVHRKKMMQNGNVHIKKRLR